MDVVYGVQTKTCFEKENVFLSKDICLITKVPFFAYPRKTVEMGFRMSVQEGLRLSFDFISTNPCSIGCYDIFKLFWLGFLFTIFECILLLHVYQ